MIQADASSRGDQEKGHRQVADDEDRRPGWPVIRANVAEHLTAVLAVIRQLEVRAVKAAFATLWAPPPSETACYRRPTIRTHMLARCNHSTPSSHLTREMGG